MENQRRTKKREHFTPLRGKQFFRRQNSVQLSRAALSQTVGLGILPTTMHNALNVIRHFTINIFEVELLYLKFD